MRLEGNGVQVKWRAELRERELERMSGLEGEWRRREAARTAEVAKIKAHYAQLDTQTRQVGSTSLQGPGGWVAGLNGRGYGFGRRVAQQATGPYGCLVCPQYPASCVFILLVHPLAHCMLHLVYLHRLFVLLIAPFRYSLQHPM